MFTVSESVPVNGPDAERRLTREQVWQALEIRARNGDERFVPPGHRFEVLEDHGDWLLRRVVLDGRDEELQRVSFHGGRVVIYDFLEGPQRSVVVIAIESDDAGEPTLRFTFLAEFAELPHGSTKEREIAAERRPMMRAQPRHVLAVARELAAERRI